MTSEGLITYEAQRLPAYTGNTFYNRRQVLNYWITFAEKENVDLDSADKDDVIQWLLWLRDEREHAHSTIAQNLLELHSIYTWIDKKDYGENICEKLEKKEDYDWLNSAPEKVKNSAEGVTYVKKQDYKLMLEACESVRETIICESLAQLGLRRVELRWLQVDSFDLDKKRVTIKTAKRYDEDGNNLFLPGFYNTQYKLLVEKWKNGERKGWVAGIDGGSDYLVTGHKKPPIRVGEVTEIVRDIADRAGIQGYNDDAMGRSWAKVTPHALRHSYGVWRAKAGMPLSQVSKLMRHADVQTTYDYYLRFSGEDLQDAYTTYRVF